MPAFRDTATATDVGHVRDSNQDAAVCKRDALVVCDGVGGHPRGGEAALAAASSALGSLRRHHDPRLAIEAADRAVHAASTRRDGHPRMATTIVLACATEGGAIVGWAGDSRGYRLRVSGRGERVLESVTEDQGVGHMLTNALGADMPGHADAQYQFVPLVGGNVLMLCSDGIHGVVPPDEIKRCLSRGDAGAMADALVRAALRYGAPDNATAAVGVW